MMRKTLVLLPLAALIACNQSDAAPAQGSAGGATTRSFPMSGFDRVALRGADDVVVRVGPAFSVRADGPAEVLARLDIRVEDGELRIGRRRNAGGWSDDDGATVTVTLPALRGAAVAGSGDMRVDRATAARFDAAVAGSGDLDIAALDTPRGAFNVAGSGDLSVQGGRAGRLSIDVAGSGNVEAGGLTADRLSVSVAGSGDVAAAARGEAEVSIVGSGDVTVRGTTRCRVSKLGSGEARCEG